MGETGRRGSSEVHVRDERVSRRQDQKRCQETTQGQARFHSGKARLIFQGKFSCATIRSDCKIIHYSTKKRASRASARPRCARMESTSGLTSSTPTVRTHTLDPTPDAPRSYNLPAIPLLIKDKQPEEGPSMAPRHIAQKGFQEGKSTDTALSSQSKQLRKH